MLKKTIKAGIKVKSDKHDDTSIHTQCLLNFIIHSKITLLSDKSAFGVVYLLSFNKSPEESPFVHITNDGNNPDVVQMILKICQIGENKRWYNGKKAAVLQKNFENEIYIQQHIFIKTITSFDAICPAIVNIIINKLSLLKPTLLSNSDNQKTTDSLNLLNDSENHGLIFMEFANGFTSLSGDEFSENLARMQLINLANLGYNHGDYHSENIMVNKNYGGFLKDQPGKALLIDFGLISNFNPINDENYCETLDKLFEPFKNKSYKAAYEWILCKQNTNEQLISLFNLRKQQIDNIPFIPLDVSPFIHFPLPVLDDTRVASNTFSNWNQNNTSFFGGDGAIAPGTQFVSNVLQTPVQSQPNYTQTPNLAKEAQSSQMTFEPGFLQSKNPSNNIQLPTKTKEILYPNEIITDSLDDIFYVYSLLKDKDKMAKCNEYIKNYITKIKNKL
jgi:hypothetical protein